MTQTRTRAWRRFKARTKKSHTLNKNGFVPLPPEKNWKLLYQRPVKQHRARQLGIEYPRKSMRQIVERECS